MTVPQAQDAHAARIVRSDGAEIPLADGFAAWVEVSKDEAVYTNCADGIDHRMLPGDELRMGVMMAVSSREVGGGGREGKSQCSGTGAPVELRDGPGWDSAGCVPFATTPAASLDAASALESLGRMARVPEEYPQVEQDEGNRHVADKLALVRSRLVVLEQERDAAWDALAEYRAAVLALVVEPSA